MSRIILGFLLLFLTGGLATAQMAPYQPAPLQPAPPVIDMKLRR